MAIVVPQDQHGAYREDLVLPVRSVVPVPAGVDDVAACTLPMNGLTVIADAAAKDEQLVRGLGADLVVPRGDDFAAAVRQEFPDGVDGLADGALLSEKALPAVKDGGTVVTVRGYTGDGRRVRTGGSRRAASAAGWC